MNPLRLAWRLWQRERGVGALATLYWSLVVACAALTAVLVFSARLEQALLSQAGELLAADTVVASRQVIPQDIYDSAAKHQLTTAETITFPSVVFAGDDNLLVAVKAVSDAYPLRGTLQTSADLGSESRDVDYLPPPGHAWAEPRVFNDLGIEPGAQVEIGSMVITVDEVVRYEPDRAGNFFSLSPRFFMNLDDARQAELLGEGARLNYRLLVAGENSGLSAFQADLENANQDRIRVLTLEDAEDRGNDALGQAQKFLSMAALTAVLLAAIAIWLSAERYASSQRSTVALLRCMGETWRPIMQIYCAKVFYVSFAALLPGLVVGYLGHWALASSLESASREALPSAGISWLFFVVLYLIVLTLAFALPQIWALRKVPPRQVLHGDEERSRLSLWAYIPALIGILVLAMGQLQSYSLTIALVGGSSVLLLVLMVAARLLITLVHKALPDMGPAWRYALGSITRRARGNALQTAAIGLGITAMLLLGIVRADLFSTWQTSLPDGTPNRFLLNIQPDQSTGVQQLLQAQGLDDFQLEPLAVGKITTINGQIPDPSNYDDPLAEERLRGSTNLSWRENFPKANEMVAGEWWDDDRTQAQVSLASRLAEPLNLKPGDRVGFRIGEVEIEARVQNIRDVTWDSFQVNFFILLNPEAAQQIPHNLITSFYLPEDQQGLDRAVSQNFPNVSVLDTDAILQRVRDIIAQVSRAAQIVFVFTLAAGLLVLITAIQAARGERRKEAAILRTLGAPRAFVLKGWLLEYALMGALAGGIAALFSWFAGWLVSIRLFDLPYAPRPGLFIIGLVLGASIVTITGWLGNRRVLQSSPMAVLRAP
ncbi:MAG: FtsX-like permease family protein [Xanthomonadales bacterium]|nr:FtsX-like permease family protein [Xanthomonadales bacterium]